MLSGTSQTTMNNQCIELSGIEFSNDPQECHQSIWKSEQKLNDIDRNPQINAV